MSGLGPVDLQLTGGATCPADPLADCPHYYSRCDLVFRVGKKAAGRLLDGRTWDEVPS